MAGLAGAFKVWLRFNRPVDEVVWPASLQRLVFDSTFDEPVDGVVWPASLWQLGLGGMTQTFDNVV